MDIKNSIYIVSVYIYIEGVYIIEVLVPSEFIQYL